MPAVEQARAYFRDLDAFLSEQGTASVDALQHSVNRFQFDGALSIPAIGLFEVLVACLVTVVFSIPALAVWIVLLATGVGLTGLRVVFSKIKRHRWAEVLRQWEADHPLEPMAQAALEQEEEPPRELLWLVRQSPRTTFDWCLNYVKALVETRDILLGAPLHQQGEAAVGGA